jgi:hypothetical protein
MTRKKLNTEINGIQYKNFHDFSQAQNQCVSNTRIHNLGLHAEYQKLTLL